MKTDRIEKIAAKRLISIYGNTDKDTTMGNRDRQRREEKKPKKPKPAPPAR